MTINKVGITVVEPLQQPKTGHSLEFAALAPVTIMARQYKVPNAIDIGEPAVPPE